MTRPDVRMAVFVGGVSAMLAATASGRAEVALSDLPPEARPAELSVYRQADVIGTQLYICGRTDAFAWAWILSESQATLLDAQKKQIGDYAMRITMIPPPPGLGSTWKGVTDEAVVATVGASGRVPGDTRAWERFDVQSREGSGEIAEARSILRISDQWAVRPSEPCDQSRAGTEARLSYTGTDLFMK